MSMIGDAVSWQDFLYMSAVLRVIADWDALLSVHACLLTSIQHCNELHEDFAYMKRYVSR